MTQIQLLFIVDVGHISTVLDKEELYQVLTGPLKTPVFHFDRTENGAFEGPGGSSDTSRSLESAHTCRCS